MYFCHANDIWRDYPELVPGVLVINGITATVSSDPTVAKFYAIAESRLSTTSESEMPATQAWRRAFARMGLKPTQYRCASESLLRRFRKDGALPRLHPLVDLCNAISLAFAIPIAVFDASRVAEYIEVRYATGAEVYLAFSGDAETPAPGEVIFADGDGRAHARRWTNRQSRYSAVSNDTRTVLIVAEAMHRSAEVDVPELTAAIAHEVHCLWSVTPTARVLSSDSPRFEF